MAAQGGLAQHILHGLASYGVAGRSLGKRPCGGDSACITRRDLRFTAPVYPGETLCTQA